MPLDFSLAGKTYEPVEATADPEGIWSYAAAADDVNPRYRVGPGQVAPPLYPVVPGFPLMMMMTADPALGVDNPLMILHGEQEVVPHREIRGGETLVLHPSLEKVKDKGRNAVFVSAIRAETPTGEAVVDQYWTIFVRGGGSGAEHPPSERSFDSPRESVAAEFTSYVDEEMPARYAAASGDHNPIHLDADAAASVGLPGVINHGLGTCALVTGGLVDALYDGDASGLARLTARFTGMVFPGDDIGTRVWESTSGFAYETVRPDGTTVMTGTLESREG